MDGRGPRSAASAPLPDHTEQIMDRPRSPMDRPRELKGTPFTRRVRAWARLAGKLLAVVCAVAAAPVIFLWFFMPETDISSAEADSLVVATADLPLRVERVTFAAGVTPMAGLLTLPSGPPPHPAVVVVHGSGPQTAQSLAWIGEAWARVGFAALTYDKRGVGGSGGRYEAVSTRNSATVLGTLAEDVLGAVAFLEEQRDIDPRRIGLVGLSQGGWIAPLAASRSDRVSFMVLYSGPTVSVGEEMFYSELTGDGDGQPDVSADADLEERMAAFDGPRGFDPLPALEALEIPALWLLGAKDRSIPVPRTRRILDGLRASGKPFEYHVFPAADHSLRSTESGEPADSWPVVEAWLESVGLP